MTTDTRAAALYGELCPLIKASPGGVTRTEVRDMMRRHGYAKGYQVDPIIAHLPADCPVWEEVDEESEVWYKLIREGDVQVKRKGGHRVAGAKQKKKGGEHVLVTEETHRRIRIHVATHGGNGKDFVEQAVIEKLEREASKK